MSTGPRLAYDGRGNAVVRSREEIESAVEQLGSYGQGLYAERWAPFVQVCSYDLTTIEDSQADCPVMGSMTYTAHCKSFQQSKLAHAANAPMYNRMLWAQTPFLRLLWLRYQVEGKRVRTVHDCLMTLEYVTSQHSSKSFPIPMVDMKA